MIVRNAIRNEHQNFSCGCSDAGEAADASLQLQPGPVPGYVSTTKAILTSFVEKHIPLAHKEKGKGKDGEGSLAVSYSAWCAQYV